ncbi:MAG: DUF1499 domain-containing protein [Alphaproteobacteria bacterium]|nr:MAG: DUF1499 domain-containing protein [Alphaproteobacteria bacterium]
MRLFIILVLVGLAFLAGITVFMIRTVKHTPIEKWHVDPMTAESPTTPNYYRVGPRDLQPAPVDETAPVYAVGAQELARALDEFALRQRDTRRIAGEPSDLWMTYVQRTEVLKFPDYISVRIIPLEDGRSTLSIFSRARFGYGDMGVNRKRVEDWLAALRPLEAPAAEPAAEPAPAPADAAPAEPPDEPASEPVSQPAATPPAEPASEPAREPAPGTSE